MILILNLVLLFTVIYFVFYIDKECLYTDQSLEKKYLLFLVIFVFELGFGVAVARIRKCVVDLDRIVRVSLLIALFSLAGLSYWQDFKNMNTWHIADITDFAPKDTVQTGFIVFFTAILFSLNSLFFEISPVFDSCLHDVYSYKIPGFHSK